MNNSCKKISVALKPSTYEQLRAVRGNKTLSGYVERALLTYMRSKSDTSARKIIREMFDNAQLISNGEHSGYCTEDIDIGKILAVVDASEKHGHWVLKVGKGSACDYHVTACCSECGWQWESLKNGVGNPRCVFGAFFTNGSEEVIRTFCLENAKQQKLYGWCPECGAKMDYSEASDREMEEK